MARPLSITAVSNAQVDTAVFKSGNGSLLLDGVDDYLYVSQPNYELRVTSAWTLECWVYVPDSNYDHAVVSSRQAGSVYSVALGFNYRTAAADTISFVTTDGFNDGAVSATGLSLAHSTWHHIAVCSDGVDQLKLFINGQLESTASSQPYVDFRAETNTIPQVIGIGRDEIVAGLDDFDGHIDELRISSTNRYTGNFTPETRHQPDDQTLLLIHMDGADGSTTFTDDVGVQGSATIDQTAFAATATATDNPSIVFLGRYDYVWDELDIDWDTWYRPSQAIDYTWDQLDFTWDDWYGQDSNTTQDLWEPQAEGVTSYDLWEISFNEELSSSFSLTVLEVLNAVLAQAQLDSNLSLSAAGGLLVDGAADLSALGFLISDSRLSDVRGSATFNIETNVSVGGGLLQDASANIADQLAFQVTGTAVRQDTVNLSLQFTVTSDARIERNAQAELASAFTLSADGQLLDLASANLASAFTVTAIGSRLVTGSSNLNVDTQVQASGLRLLLATANLESQFTVSADSEITRTASANLSAIATVSASAEVDISASAELSSQIQLTATSRILKLAEIELINFATLEASAEVSISASATLESQFTQTARGGRIVQPLEVYEYTWDSLDAWESFFKDQWDVNGFIVFDNFVTESIGGLLQSGQSSLDNQFFVESQIDIYRGGLANLSSQFDLSAATIKLVRGSAELSALALQLTAAGLIKTSDVTNIDLAFQLSSTASTIIDGRAGLSALGFLISDSRLSDVRGSANLPVSFACVFAGEILLLDSDFIYRVLPELRSITPLNETRRQPVLYETRNTTVPSEKRQQPILPETRVLEIDY